MRGQGYEIDNRVGRLLVARVFELATAHDVDAYSHDIGIHLLRMPKDVRPILCADHRPVMAYSPTAEDRLVELFKQMNERLERVAILVSRTNVSLGKQLQRIVSNASSSARRVVFTPDEAHAHLAAVLEPDELSAMRDFLVEFEPFASGRFKV